MKSIIHVNQHVIRANYKQGWDLPPLIVRTYKGAKKAHEVEILGPSKVVHRPRDPLPCGARVWIETQAEVLVK